MSDPIEKLTRLGDAMEGAPVPLPASEIRARGDRIRRRKHAVIAGASAAVIAAVAVPVVAFTMSNGSDRSDDLAPQPTGSDPNVVPSAALSEDNLLTDEDAGPAYGGAGSWTAHHTSYGDGHEPFHPCATRSLADLGAEPVYRRDFGVTSGAPLASLTAVAGEFRNDDAARSAYHQLSTALRDCDQGFPGGTRYSVENEADVALETAGEAHRILATYVPEGTTGFRGIVETGLILSGDRLEVLVSVLGAQDYDFDNPPMERILPAAATRLVLGGTGEGDDTPSDSWPTTLPADFPLVSGWPEDDGSDEYQLTEPSSDNQAMLPAGELQGCQDIDAVDPADRLTTRLSRGSASYAREVQLFDDPDEAAAYLDSVQDAYSACEAEGPTTDGPPFFTTEVSAGSLGEESVVVTRASDGIGRTVITVVRVGNGVVVDLAGDEDTGDTVMDLATETRENLADVVGALNAEEPPS